MSSLEFSFINALLYIGTLIYFLMRYKFSLGSIIWSLYTISAMTTYLFIKQPMYTSSIHACIQTLHPYIYLYVINLISIYPLFKLKKISDINWINKNFLHLIMIICIMIQMIFIIIDLPAVIKVMSSPSNMLADLRGTVYGNEGLSIITKNPILNKLNLLFSGFRLLLTGLSIVVFVTYKENKIMKNLFFFVTLFNNLRIIIIQVGRGELVIMFLFYLSIFYLMRNWINKKQLYRIIVFSIPLIIAGIIFFWAISVSRFGDNATFFLYKYLGEPMNNFNGILFDNIRGSCHGRAYFPLYYRYVLGQVDYMNTYEKWNLIYRMTGIRGDIFYTWIGGLIIDFGKIAPIFVAILLNYINKKIIKIKRFFIGDLLLIIFVINFFLRGLFLFPIQNFEGTLMIVYTIILFLLFRIYKNKNGNLVYRIAGRTNKMEK